MDFTLYSEGIQAVLQAEVLLALLIGTLAGIMIGALPGLSPTMAIAILSPITFQLDLIPALAVLVGVYSGGMYGGSIGAILLNIPGHAGAVLTAIEGYPMHQRGETDRAIGLAVISSFMGGMFSILVLSLLAPILAGFALRFTFHEYFSIALFGLLLISYVGQGNRTKAVIAGFAGIFISFVGTDPLLGFSRYTFGSINLRDGLNIVPVFVGLFGLSELLMQVIQGNHTGKAATIDARVKFSLKKVGVLFGRIKSSVMSLVRGSVIGVLIGAAPGTGGTIGSIVAYGVERSVSKHPEDYGTGVDEALVSIESANNATTGGAMIPLLTLGIPGDAVTAILIGTFLIHGVTPGPMMFVEQTETVSAIFLLLAIASMFFLVAGLAWGFSVASLLNRIPREFLIVAIMTLCVVGTFSVRGNAFDVYVMLAFGVLGVLMNLYGFSKAPLILGFILGGIVEDNFRRALILGRGDYTEFLTKPISALFLVACVVIVLTPFIRNAVKRSKEHSMT